MDKRFIMNSLYGRLVSRKYYKERFIIEYKETKERYDKLHKIIVKYTANKLGFKLNCDIELLKEQAKHMGNYLFVLEVRAQIEGIDLDGSDENDRT